MEMNINNILVKMLLRENRKVVLTENSLDKAIDKARKQVLSPIYIDLFSQIEDKEELLRDPKIPIYVMKDEQAVFKEMAMEMVE